MLDWKDRLEELSVKCSALVTTTKRLALTVCDLPVTRCSRLHLVQSIDGNSISTLLFAIGPVRCVDISVKSFLKAFFFFEAATNLKTFQKQ